MRIGGRSLEQRRPSKLHIYVCIHVSNRPRERDRCVRFHESSKILLSFHSTPALSILKEDTRLERVASRGLINSSGKPGFVSLLPLPARQRGRRRRRSKIEINFGSVIGREAERGAIIYTSALITGGGGRRRGSRGWGDLFYRMLNFMRPLRAFGI